MSVHLITLKEIEQTDNTRLELVSSSLAPILVVT